MQKIHEKLPYILVLALGLLALAYLLFPRDDATPASEALCVFAIDVDGSTAAIEGQLERYVQWVDDAVFSECLPYHARAVAVPLTSQTATDPIEPIVFDLVGNNLTGSPKDQERHAAKAEAFVDAVRELVANGLRSQGESGTDLIALSQVVSPYLDNTGTETQFLWVLTDGVNRRSPYNFAMIDMSDAAVKSMIDVVREDAPLMADTSVYMYGVGVGFGTSDFTVERLDGIEEFWRQYFEAGGVQRFVYAKAPPGYVDQS